MGVVLGILLNPQSEPNVDSDEGNPMLAVALDLRDPKTGVTMLGQAVAWGYDEAVSPIMEALR